MGAKYCGNSSYFGASAIFLLFFDHIDTESDSQEMEIGVPEIIFSKKNIKSRCGTKISIP